MFNSNSSVQPRKRVANISIEFLTSQLPPEVIHKTIQNMNEFKLEDTMRIRVLGNVTAIDSLWKDYRIDSFCKMCTDEQDILKYSESKRDILRGVVKIPPILYFSGELTFENGRNRFANLRDSGVTKIPIIILRSQLAMFKRAGIVNEVGRGGGTRKKQSRQKRQMTRNRLKHQTL